MQRTRIALEEGARFEWLPLEAICYSGCIAQNHVTLDLAPGAELIGWDVAALGLPEAQLPFEQGSLLQHLELRDAWLERGRIEASDARLMNGPLGLAGQRCIATLFLAAGSDLSRARRDQALELAREVIAAHPLSTMAGATAPGPRVVVVRVLAPLVEPALRLAEGHPQRVAPGLVGPRRNPAADLGALSVHAHDRAVVPLLQSASYGATGIEPPPRVCALRHGRAVALPRLQSSKQIARRSK